MKKRVIARTEFVRLNRFKVINNSEEEQENEEAMSGALKQFPLVQGAIRNVPDV